MDQDIAVCHSITVLLAGLDPTIRSHPSAEEYLAACARVPDCLILETRLPGMSGLDLLRHLGTTGSVPPTILLTSDGDVATVVEGMRAGAVDFIEKPFAGRILTTRVHAVLRRLQVPRQR